MVQFDFPKATHPLVLLTFEAYCMSTPHVFERHFAPRRTAKFFVKCVAFRFKRFRAKIRSTSVGTKPNLVTARALYK